MRKAMHDYRNWTTIDWQRAETAFKDEAKERIERANWIEKELPAVEKAVASLERENPMHVIRR